jgi:hypothetical protein
LTQRELRAKLSTDLAKALFNECSLIRGERIPAAIRHEMSCGELLGRQLREHLAIEGRSDS